ncbi:MAG: helix-turn-helix transcriptional regulator [Spirochaetales bacterium]|nr:helix-turn-helix transcriptional regulator [Spirochaetales bacterium]MCF7938968.1 helix-turn-helix transcriptional regulator [Spirochaetales bacterium]
MNRVQRLLSFNLKRNRSRRGLSQMALAEKSRVSPGYIGDIERGKKFPSAAVLDRLAAALEVQVSSLFLEEDEESSRPDVYDVLFQVKEALRNRFDSEVGEIFRRYIEGLPLVPLDDRTSGRNPEPDSPDIEEQDNKNEPEP